MVDTRRLLGLALNTAKCEELRLHLFKSVKNQSEDKGLYKATFFVIDQSFDRLKYCNEIK